MNCFLNSEHASHKPSMDRGILQTKRTGGGGSIIILLLLRYSYIAVEGKPYQISGFLSKFGIKGAKSPFRG